MHRQEVDARADLLRGHGLLVLVARRACPLRIDAHDVEVQRMRVARVTGQRLDPVQLRHGSVVGADVPLADLPVPLDLVQLAEGDRRQDVGEVRLVARHGDVVQRAMPAPHHAKVVDRVCDLGVVGRDHPALAGGDVLRGVEREARRLGERPDLATAVRALDGVRRVLDHG